MIGASPRLISSTIRSFGLHEERPANHEHLLLATGQQSGRRRSSRFSSAGKKRKPRR